MKLSLLSILLGAIFMLNGQHGFGQFTPEPYKAGSHQQPTQQEVTLRADENLLWHEDFAEGLPVDWVNENVNGFCAFQHTYQGPQGPYSIGMPPLNSLTAENGFMILDSDLCTSQNDDGSLTNAYLQSPPIAIQGVANLMLSFQHNFRYCCSPEQTLIMVEVSTDGLNWTSFDVRNGLAPNNTSPNPVYQAIDITDITMGEEQLWVRFRKTGASHYWWMIDDVMLVSFVDNDLEILETSNNGGYAKIPAGQQQPLLLEAKVKNAGGDPQTNVVLTTTVNEYLFQSTLTEPVLNPAQIMDFAVSEPFLAPGRGNYHVEFSVEQDQEDMFPENNHADFHFQVTDTTYSRAGDALLSDLHLASQPSGVFAAGNRYEVIEAIDVTAVSFALHHSTQPGATVFAKVFQWENDEFTEAATSGAYILTAEDINGVEATEPGFVVLSFSLPITLEPGQYVAVLYAPAQEQTIALAAALTPFQPADASFYQEGELWQPTEITPLVEMHFGLNQAECAPQYHFSITNSLCGTSSGAIEAIPLTGFGPYVYAWTDYPEINEPLLANLMAGDYEVTITDAYGCESVHTVTVEDEEIDVNYTMQPAICDAGGSLEVIPENGTEPFVYTWAHDVDLVGPLAEGLASGTYEVTVKDANDCEVLVSMEVENVEELPVHIVSQDAFCGSASGSIALEPQAGMEPYTFTWDDFPDNDQASQQNLTPGTYSFTVTDSNNCQFAGSAVVEEDFYQLQAVVEKENASCGLENGTASVELLNGQAPFAFEWSNGFDQAEAFDLAPGEYQVEITDDYGCADTQIITIENFGQMPSVTWEAQDAEGCGQTTGAFVILPVEEEAQYVYTLLLDKKEGGEEGQGKAETNGFTLDNLAAGQYHVSVENTDGCELIVAINVSDAGAPAIAADVQHVTCHGLTDGAITLSLEDATDPAYLWDNDENSTSAQIENLPAGVYSVVVTDGECVAVESYEIVEPGLLLAQASIDHIVCANEETGNIILTLSGGTPPFTFIWNNGYSGKDLLDVPAGDYTVEVRDFNECFFEQTYTITGNEPLLVEAEVTNADEGLDNGMIVLSVTGGLGDYTFVWSNGEQSSVVTGLATGTYEVTITDEAGCEVTETYMIATVGVNNPLVAAEGISIFPNPANDRLNVRLQTGNRHLVTTLKAEVINILGEKVVENSIASYVAGDTFSISLDELKKGIYILQVSSESHTWQAKFIKK